MVRDALRLLLETEGLPVRTYGSAPELLADDAVIGCLIVDLHMPGTDGLDLVKKLRAGAKTPPVILVSGRLDPAARRRAGDLGVRWVLEKPFAADGLLSLVHQALGGPGCASGMVSHVC